MPLRRLSLALLLALLAVGGGIGTSRLFSRAGEGEIESVVGGGLGFEVFLGILAFAGAALSREGLAARLGLRRGHLSSKLVALLILGTLGASFALDGLLDVSGLKEHSALGEFERLLGGARGRPLLTAALGFAVAPGISEELLCRGLFQRGLVRRMGAPAGILLASLIFGALHVDPVHAAFAAALGLYLGAASYLSGGIRTSIACHTCNNLVAVGTTAYFPSLASGGVLAIPAGLSIALGTLWVVWRHSRRSGEPGSSPPGTAEPRPL